MARCGLHGRIESFPLAELVQTLHLSGRTCRIRVDGPDADGTVWLANGTTVHASAPGRDGEEAFHEILRWGRGDFHVEDDAEAPRRTIASDTMFLLLEALRRIDESGEDGREDAGVDSAASEPTPPAKPRRRAVLFATLSIAALACTGLAWVTTMDGPRSPERVLAGEAAVTTREVPIALARSTGDGPGQAPSVETPIAPTPAPPAARATDGVGTTSSPKEPTATSERAGDALIGPDPQLARDPAPLIAALLPGPYFGPVGAPQAPAAPLGSLALEVVSRVPAGVLVVEIDDRLALRREVRWDAGTGKRLFQRIAGTDGDRFGERFTLGAGSHTVVARLINESLGTEHEVRLVLSIEEDAERSYRLVASRKNGGTLAFREQRRSDGRP